MRKILLCIVSLVCVATVFVATSVIVAYRASQKVPDFYQAALEQEAEQLHAGDQLEMQMLDFHNEVRREGRWEAVFTDQQINGWLASDLPDKFPRILPRGVKEPRIMIDQEQALIACRYESSKLSTVVTLTLDVQLTEEPNVVAVRVQQARAGLLPLPLNKSLDRVTAVAHKAHIPVRWEQADGDPIALVTIPSEHEDYRYRQILLDTVELREGEIFLAGRTETPSPGTTAARVRMVAAPLAARQTSPAAAARRPFWASAPAVQPALLLGVGIGISF